MTGRWVLLAATVVIAACSNEADVPAPTPTKTTEAPVPASAGIPIFADVAAAVGIDFQHFIGTSGHYYFPEMVGPGVALFDYDLDGDLDVYVLQGAMLEPGAAPATALIPPLRSGEPVNRLYRNELIPGGRLVFTDVTGDSGLDDPGYGMGAAVGDTDNDGDPDLFISNFGQNRLYENNGDGTFRAVPDALQVDSDEEWTTSASFVDYDRDGDLDLFATNYVGFTMANNIECAGSKGQREYCGPTIYPPTTDRLWRNDGNQRFVDVSDQSGITAAAGNGLGTSAVDFDGDGDVDIYVANDLMANRLWVQRDDGTFAETALMSGAAYNANGSAEASMGVTAGDFDADGDEDLFMTHLNTETNTLYQNDGSGFFVDVTDSVNLAAASLRLTGFGTGWFDYDNDSYLDLFIANGAVTTESGEGVDPDFPYGQINQLYRNDGGRFRDVTSEAGETVALKETSRGAAFGDIDNDGDVDVLVSNGNGPLRLLLNQTDNGHAWLRVKLIGKRSNRDGAGSRVVAFRDGKKPLWRRAHTDGSYLSASDIRVHFGLGDDPGVAAIGVIWPDQRRELWRDVAANADVTLVEGSGEPWTDDTTIATNQSTSNPAPSDLAPSNPAPSNPVGTDEK